MHALALAGAPALATPGALAECRALHVRSTPEYVRCLEAALEGRDSEPAEAAETAAKPLQDPVPGGMGLEQIRDVEDEELPVRIVATTYNSRGLGTFRMEDGQVWRETTASPERKHLDPEKQYAARIVRGKVGGYRMHVDGVRWMKTVERVE